MKITISEAERIATILVEPLSKEISELEKQLIDIANKNINESLPDEIKKCANKYPRYFDFRTNVSLSNGSQMIYVDGVDLYPSSAKSHYYNNPIPCTQGNAELISKLNIKIGEKCNEKTKLHKTIKETILQLRTYKKIREQFPEAAEYIEEEGVSTEIGLPINDIRNILNKYKE